LQSTGVKLVGKLLEESWGSVVAFEDPDGNILKVMEPKITGR
jgi:predicted enzyme related to lactoylglutathione lyase